MTRILLHLDEEFFYKLKRDKLDKEEAQEKRISWENYIKLIFGFKSCKEDKHGNFKN